MDQDPSQSFYNYVPTIWICGLFVALYSISTILHIGQLIHYRMWFMIPTVVFCGILEILGWSARLWSGRSVFLKTPFIMQITALIIGPTPLLAATFVIFGMVVQRLGSIYIRLSPKIYTSIFLICDIAALIVQSIGGAAASAASDRNDPVGARRGANIMLGGIIFQLVVIILFSLCAIEFMVRYSYNRPIRKQSDAIRGSLSQSMKILVGALALNLACLFTRSVYRTIELKEGWDGRIIATQVYFNVLDGAMIAIAILTLNIAHPGYLLKRHDAVSRSKLSPSKEGSTTPV